MKTVVHDCTTACLGKSWFLVYVVIEYAELYPTIQVVRQSNTWECMCLVTSRGFKHQV